MNATTARKFQNPHRRPAQGSCRGDYLRSWLGEMLAEEGIRTFADLRLDDPGQTADRMD
jgi:NTE family protein